MSAERQGLPWDHPDADPLGDIARAFAAAMGETVRVTHAMLDSLQDAGLIPEPAPEDPRQRALWAKQQRGTGPQPEPLRRRGRTPRYLAGRS